MQHILITVGTISLPAKLNDSPTTQQVWDALPIEGHVNTWGDETYLEITVVAC